MIFIRYYSWLIILFMANCCSGCRNEIDPKLMTMPLFKLRSIDSATLFEVQKKSDKAYSILFYFDPNCQYSQKQLQTIIGNIKEVEIAQFYLFSTSSLRILKDFAAYYQLEKYNNIAIGRDEHNYFAKNFSPKSFPWLVIYDRQNKLKKIIIGSTDIQTLINILGP